MPRRSSSARRDAGYGLLAFAIPTLLLYRYVVTWSGQARTIGNDFGVLYYGYKVYLLDGLSHLRFPLWSPSEAAGFPFYSNPFAQAFYPLNLPLAILYRLRGGYSYYDHQVFTVVGIGLFAVGLYGWLRSLALDRHAALFGAVVVGTSVKITELVRFPNAVHTAAWLPFILWGCTLIARGDRYVRGAVLVLASTVLLLTAGYFYYVYYSLFLVPPYVVLLAWSRTRVMLLPESRVRPGPFAIATAASFGGAIAICAPYLLAVARLMSQTVDRAGTSYEYSTMHQFTAVDSVGSWVFPPAAQMEGWYYFGIAGVLVLAAWWLLDRAPRNGGAATVRLRWILALWFAIVTYITWGRQSYLFGVLWHTLPGFSSLRVWGRMNVILLPLIALGLAHGYARVRAALAADTQPSPGFLVRFSAVYVAVLGVQCFLYATKAYDPYWIQYFLPLNDGFDERVFIVFGAAAYLALAGAFLAARRPNRRPALGHALLPGLLCLSLLDVGSVATRQWSWRTVPPTRREQLQIDSVDRRALDTPRRFAYTTISLTPVFSVGYVANWYFARYVDFVRQYAPDSKPDGPLPAAMAALLGAEDGGRLFLSSRIDHVSIEGFLHDARAFSAVSPWWARVESYTGDVLRVRVRTAGGYLSFIDNWAPGWTASVDGRPVAVARLFGTFKAVKLEQGTYVVEFRYAPEIWLPHG